MPARLTGWVDDGQTVFDHDLIGLSQRAIAAVGRRQVDDHRAIFHLGDAFRTQKRQCLGPEIRAMVITKSAFTGIGSGYQHRHKARIVMSGEHHVLVTDEFGLRGQ